MLGVTTCSIWRGGGKEEGREVVGQAAVVTERREGREGRSVCRVHHRARVQGNIHWYPARGQAN